MASMRRSVKRAFVKLIAAGVLFLGLPAWGDDRTAWPDSLIWDGIQAKTLRPSRVNLDALLETRDSVIRYAWSIAPVGFLVDTAWQDGSLLLRASSAKGPFTVGFCLENGGLPVCDSLTVRITNPVAVAHGNSQSREPLLPKSRIFRSGRGGKRSIPNLLGRRGRPAE